MLLLFQKVWKHFQFLGIILLDSWALLLALMLIFALNRYAVSWIESERREIHARLVDIEKETEFLEKKIGRISLEKQSCENLKFQEMKLIEKMLIVPDNCEMFYWKPVSSDSK